MTDHRERIIKRAILFVADAAWEISVNKEPPEACVAIEALSDDPEINARLVAAIIYDLDQSDNT